MRKFMILVLTLAMGLGPFVASTQATAANQADGSPRAGLAAIDHRLLSAGAGAIAGVVVFNMLTYPYGSVPFVAAPLAGTPMDIALGSRVIAALAGGSGALIAHYLYGYYNNPE